MCRSLALLFLSLPAVAQTTTFEGHVSLAWEAHVDVELPTDQQYRDVATSGGQVFATGVSGSGETELFVTATDAATGAELWIARYQGLPDLGAEGVSIGATDSVVVVGGLHDDSDAPGHQAVLLGLSRADGSLLWTRVLGSLSGLDLTFRTTVARIAVPPSGFPVLALTRSEFIDSVAGFDFTSTDGLRAIDPATGLDVWSVGTLGIHEAADLRISPGGAEVAVVGSFADVGIGLNGYDFVVQSRSVSTGGLIWSRAPVTGLAPSFPPPGGKSVVWSDDGLHVFACGDGSADQVFAFDAAGNPVWSGGEAGFAAQRLALDGAGGVFVAGSAGGAVRTLELSEATGSTVNGANGPSAERVEALALDRVSGRAVVASADGPFSGSDVWRLNAFDTSSGVPDWEVALGGADGLDDWVRAIAVDASGRLFAVGERAAPSADGDGVLEARAVSDGAPLWSASYGAGQPSDQRVDAAVLSEDGAVLFVCGRRGFVNPGSSTASGHSAWVSASSSADGSELWSTGLDPVSSFPLSANAIVEAPVAGRVLVAGSLDADRGHVTALDRATGQVQWQAAIDNHVSDYDRLSDVDVVPGAGVAIATTRSATRIGAVALDLATGAELWGLAKGPTDANHPPQLHVTSDGTRALLVGSSYGSFGSKGDFVVLALDPLTGAIAWAGLYDWSGAQEWWDADHLKDAVLSADDTRLYLFGRSDVDNTLQGGTFWASVDTATGAESWSLASPSGQFASTHSPKHVALSPDGATLFGLATRTPSGAISDYRLHVQAVDAAAGQELWSVELVTGLADQFNGYGIAVTPNGASVVVAAGDGTGTPEEDAHGLTVAFDAGTGALLWRATLEGVGLLDESTRAVIPLSDGRRVVAASQSSSDPAHRDLVLQALELPTLTAGPDAISIAAGGAQTFHMSGGVAQAGNVAFLLGSLSGTSPGVVLGPGLVVPLNIDAYATQTLSSPNTPPLSGSLAVLDASGYAQAVLTLPAGAYPTLAGLTVHHAWLAFEPAGLALVSNPVSLALAP